MDPAKNINLIQGEGAFEYLAKAEKLEREGKKILHFEIGQPDFPTPDHIKKAAFAAIEDNLTGYVNATGVLGLKQVIAAEIEQTHGYKPSEDQILILPGAKPGIFFTMLALLEKGDEVIFPDPGFPTYGSVATYLQATPKPVVLKEENHFRMQPEDIAKAVTNKTKLLILNSPQNPTGSVMTRDELDQISSLAEKHGFFILSDEIYSKMLYEGKFHSVTNYDHCEKQCILLDGFSKAYAMTGWRLGYLVGPSSLMEKMGLLMINALSCTTTFVQHAGITALTGTQAPLKEMMVTFKKRRDAIVAGLNSIPGFSCKTPLGAFYAFANIKKTGLSSREMADKILYEAGVCCLPGTAFGPGGEGYIRFSYATSTSNIDRAIDQIKQSKCYQ